MKNYLSFAIVAIAGVLLSFHLYQGDHSPAIVINGALLFLFWENFKKGPTKNLPLLMMIIGGYLLFLDTWPQMLAGGILLASGGVCHLVFDREDDSP
ncbi:MAG: hypothetical protein AAGM67_00975 [Bacteroidota bacterium]